MSAITLIDNSCYLIELTPGVILTLTTPVRLRDDANVLVFSVPTLVEGAGIAATQGALNLVTDPVLPVLQAGPIVLADAGGTPMLVGPAIWSITLRQIQWKLLLSPLQAAPVLLIVWGGYDQDIAWTAAPSPQVRRVT